MKIQLTHPNAKLPSKKRIEDAGYDLYTPIGFTLYSGDMKTVNIGIKGEVPSGYYAQIFGKSKLASQGLMILGGVIDQNYRGEWGVILSNFSPDPIHFSIGDAIAQVVLLPYLSDPVIKVESLSETDRGETGIWSEK